MLYNTKLGPMPISLIVSAASATSAKQQSVDEAVANLLITPDELTIEDVLATPVAPTSRPGVDGWLIRSYEAMYLKTPSEIARTNILHMRAPHPYDPDTLNVYIGTSKSNMRAIITAPSHDAALDILRCEAKRQTVYDDDTVVNEAKLQVESLSEYEEYLSEHEFVLGYLYQDGAYDYLLNARYQAFARYYADLTDPLLNSDDTRSFILSQIERERRTIYI